MLTACTTPGFYSDRGKNARRCKIRYSVKTIRQISVSIQELSP